jgi:hypothetical protein
LGIDYLIFDGNNEFLPAHYTPFFWLDTDIFKIEIFNAGHTLPICRSINNALNLGKSLGYESFVFTEADVILNEQDGQRLWELLTQIKQQDKKMLFFKPEGYRDCGGSYVYETLLFGGNINYFLSTFKPPLNLEEWLAIPMGYTLELSFYERFSHDEEKFLIINDHSSNYFNSSEVNLLRYGLFNCELLYNERVGNCMLFIMNSLISGKKMTVEITKGGSTETIILHKNQYWLNSYDRSNDTITIAVKDEEIPEELFLHKTFDLSEDPEKLNKKGIIKYK